MLNSYRNCFLSVAKVFVYFYLNGCLDAKMPVVLAPGYGFPKLSPHWVVSCGSVVVYHLTVLVCGV